MAYLGQSTEEVVGQSTEEVVDTMLDLLGSPDYSPAISPEEPQLVESSDSESSSNVSLFIPNFLELTVAESLSHLLKPLDE
eukprot:1737270-Amphidinium_carterae.1